MNMQQNIAICRQRVMKKLFSLEPVEKGLEGSLAGDISAQEKKGFFQRDFGMDEWDWPQGIGLYGLANSLGGETDEVRQYIEAWYGKQKANGLPSRNINTTMPLLTLMDYDFGEKLALDWMGWLEKDALRTAENGLQHVTTGRTKDALTLNAGQIWIDTLFMTNLFIARMGVKYKNRQWKEESVYQVLLHIKYLLDKESSLFYHGWTFAGRNNFSAAFWARGNSWFTLGIPLFLRCMEKDLSAAERSYILQAYQEQVAALLVCIDPQEHMWHTLLDDPSSYIETSGSAAILAGIFYGLSAGYLAADEGLIAEVQEALRHIMEKVDGDGEVHDVSAGTPIGETRDAYKEIIKAPMAYGQALMLVLLHAAEGWEASIFEKKMDGRAGMR